MTQNINFLDYKYYPALRTRVAELNGLKMLSLEQKRKILPILTLGEWPRAEGVGRSLDKSSEACEELPFIADITSVPSYAKSESIQNLKQANNGFQNWRNELSAYANAIPVVQFSSSPRDFIQQVLHFESVGKKVVFRIKDFQQDTLQVINALSAMNEISNALVLIDCQYIRDTLPAYVAATISTINQIRSLFPSVYISVLSTSFPASVLEHCSDMSRESGVIDILEYGLFERIGGVDVAAYGDHSSIHSVVYDDVSIRTPVPRIDYPEQLSWSFERRNYSDSEQSYIECAKKLIQKFPNIKAPTCWGETQIHEASKGNVFSKGAGSWISVRVNIHLTKQIDFHYAKPIAPDDDDLTDLL